MQSQRLVLFFVFTMSVFLLYEGWQRDQNPTNLSIKSSELKPAPVAPSAPGVPVPSALPATIAPTATAVVSAPSAVVKSSGELITVVTDVYRAQISTMGGDLVSLELLQHGHTLDAGKVDGQRNFLGWMVNLFNLGHDTPTDKNMFLFKRVPDHTYVAQSGLIGAQLPTHQSMYTAAASSFEMGRSGELEVRLQANDASKSAKIYRFKKGSYVVDVSHELTNTSQQPLETHAYFQLMRDGKPPIGDSVMVPTFTGAAVYTDQEKYHKVSFGDIDKAKVSYPKVATDGWIGLVQHYFLGAWVPKPGVSREFYTRTIENGFYTMGLIIPSGVIAPGATKSFSVPLYAGPQDQATLAALSPGLDLVVDYGWLTVIASPLFLGLQWIHGWVSNWGVAIVILTILIKLLFYPLSEASYRSMAKMRVVAPKLQRLKDQYGSDRQRMQLAMMELYKTEKINPLGGCLPVLIQIPVFIALYSVLLASVEMRQAPFMLWINDLSAPDAILPFLMAATMIFQTSLNPEPPDPVQAKVMKIMPVVFSLFFFFSPAGLVLYWLVNNILSIAQQWYITKQIEDAAPKANKR